MADALFLYLKILYSSAVADSIQIYSTVTDLARFLG